jgi:hypothetical protein
MPQERPIEIYMENSSAIALANNPIFHDRSTDVDTQDFITYKIALQIRKLKSCK